MNGMWLISIPLQVTTEDEEHLEDNAAEQGLVLRLAPAGRGRAEEITVSMDPGAVHLTTHQLLFWYTATSLRGVLDRCIQTRTQGFPMDKPNFSNLTQQIHVRCQCMLAQSCSMSCAGSSRPGEGVYGFPSEELTQAGEYAVTAEFTETRSELTRLLTKKTAVLRSPAATFRVTFRVLLSIHHSDTCNLVNGPGGFSWQLALTQVECGSQHMHCIFGVLR